MDPSFSSVVSSDRFLNRELSSLEFNARVLSMAEDPRQRLMERIKFLAIFSSNMDEFFEIRVAGLKNQLAAGIGSTTPDMMTPLDQLKAIRARVISLLDKMHNIFQSVCKSPSAELHLTSWEALNEDEKQVMIQRFEENVYPVLTPLAVDPGHPFPYISNFSFNLALIVKDSNSGERRFARVKVPRLLPRFITLPDNRRFLPLEQVVAARVHTLFPGMEIESCHGFRVTRNADLTVDEDECEDLLSTVEMELRKRRFGRAVRIEVAKAMPPEVMFLVPF